MWWWVSDPIGQRPLNYVAVDDIVGGLDAILDFLNITPRKECPF